MSDYAKEDSKKLKKTFAGDNPFYLGLEMTLIRLDKDFV